jgi:hypothetical protein
VFQIPRDVTKQTYASYNEGKHRLQVFEHRLQVSEHKLHRAVFGSKKDEVSKQFGILHKEELCELLSPFSVITLANLRDHSGLGVRISWMKRGYIYNFVGTPPGSDQL